MPQPTPAAPSPREAAVPGQRRLWFCTGCGNCCRWPGDVKLTDDDITRIAAHLALSEAEFVERYTRLRRDRRGLSLVERADDACVFLSEDDRCSIQPVKPKQCRDYPNGWNQEGFEDDCAAIALRYRLRRVAADGDTPYGT